MKITKEELENIVAEVVNDVYAIDEKLPTALRPADRQVGKKRGQLNPGDPDYPSNMGELRHLIKLIQSSKRSDELAKVLSGSILDLVSLGQVSTIKNLKNIYSAPDDKKTNTDLDKLNIDDEVSQIVDDTIEDKFLKHILIRLRNMKDEEPIPDLNSRLQRFIRRTHLGRTIADVPQGDLFESISNTGESIMKITKQELIDIIRESINDIDPEDALEQQDVLREALIALIHEIIKGDPDNEYDHKNKEFYYSGKGKFTEQNLEASKEEIKDYYNNKTKYGWAASTSATREELDKLLENVLGVTDTLGKPKYNSKKDALEKMLNVINLEDITIMGGPELAKKLNKITESELKKIIKEETEQVLSEFEERKHLVKGK